MTKISKVRFGSVISAAFLATVAVPASAEKWMVIGAEPDRSPNRSIYVMSADKTWVTKRFVDGFVPAQLDTVEANTIRTVSVYQVFEKAGGTNFISYSVDFKCQEGLVSIPQAISYDRAGKQEKGGSPKWMKVPNNWMGKAEMIACDWKNWQSAKQIWGGDSAPPSKRKKNKEPAVSFASLGMEYLGEANYYMVTEVVNLVWSKRWTDAVQPAYYDGTPAEKAAASAKLAEMQNKIKTTLVEAKTKVEFDIKTQDKIDKKLGRIGDKFFREMQGIAGNSEDRVIERWGIPQGLIETTPGVRQLNYYWSDTENIQVPYTVDVMGTNGMGGLMPVGQRTEYRSETRNIQCYRKLFLKVGGQLPGYRVFDFDVGCS